MRTPQVAQALGLGKAKLAFQTHGLSPGEQVLGDQHELELHLVVGEGVEGQDTAVAFVAL